MRLEARGHVLGSQNSVRKQGGWGGAESWMEARGRVCRGRLFSLSVLDVQKTVTKAQNTGHRPDLLLLLLL